MTYLLWACWPPIPSPLCIDGELLSLSGEFAPLSRSQLLYVQYSKHCSNSKIRTFISDVGSVKIKVIWTWKWKCQQACNWCQVQKSDSLIHIINDTIITIPHKEGSYVDAVQIEPDRPCMSKTMPTALPTMWMQGLHYYQHWQILVLNHLDLKEFEYAHKMYSSFNWGGGIGVGWDWLCCAEGFAS